ncbi:MAG: D-2-hydroxyacid dehydrogenase [Variibacter sp.]
MLPSKQDLNILFAHVAYQLGPRFALRKTGIQHRQVSDRAELNKSIGSADVLVISGLWDDKLLENASKLKFIQSIGAGTDQFSREPLRKRNIRLASANMRAVSDHAMSLILALARRLPEARDNQAKKHWRGMISDLEQREDELSGKTLVIVGLGAIGGRLVKLAKAFDMNVLGVKRDTSTGHDLVDSVHHFSDLKHVLPRADYVALTCPLTKETENLIDGASFAAMKPSAFLVNAARGRCVNEAALIDALSRRRIAGAAIDVTAEEPLPSDSPLWTTPRLFITPHTAGETRRYEDNVLDILTENVERLWNGEARLRNQII